jgi:hypothetical protein
MTPCFALAQTGCLKTRDFIGKKANAKIGKRYGTNRGTKKLKAKEHTIAFDRWTRELKKQSYCRMKHVIKAVLLVSMLSSCTPDNSTREHGLSERKSRDMVFKSWLRDTIKTIEVNTYNCVVGQDSLGLTLRKKVDVTHLLLSVDSPDKVLETLRENKESLEGFDSGSYVHEFTYQPTPVTDQKYDLIESVDSITFINKSQRLRVWYSILRGGLADKRATTY